MPKREKRPEPAEDVALPGETLQEYVDRLDAEEEVPEDTRNLKRADWSEMERYDPNMGVD